MGDIGGVFRPHRVIVECLERLLLWGWRPNSSSAGDISRRTFKLSRSRLLVELRSAVRAEILLYTGHCSRGKFHSDSGHYFLPLCLYLLCDKRCRRIRGSGLVRIHGGRVGHYKLIGMDIAALARPCCRPFECHEICLYSLYSGRTFSRVCRLARDSRRTGVRRFGFRPGDLGAPGSRSQRSGPRLDSRVVTLPLVCLAASPPDQRMWALRFGLSPSGLRHGSVLDRASQPRARFFLLQMESDEFVHLLAYVRHPTLLVPSTWPLGAFGETAAFAAAVWNSGSETDQREHLAKAVAITTVLVAIMLCFFLGWFFVEVVPTRWAAAMYFYRLVTVFAWLGWVLVGASIAKQFALKNLRWAVLGLVSVFSAPALLLYQAALFASVNGTARRSTLFFVTVTVLVVVTGFVFPGLSRRTALFVVVGGLVVTAAIGIFPRLGAACLAVMAAVLILIVSVLARHRSGLLAGWCRTPSFVAALQPALDLDDLRERREGCPQADLASAARSRTEPDALFLVPWIWRMWRILAQRAVIVDWKAFPFREEGMREWHRRYLAIYDPEHGAGYPNDCTEGTL